MGSRVEAAFSLVAACVREHDWAAAPEGLATLLARTSLDDVVRTAVAHRVAGCVHRSVSAMAGDGAFAPLADEYHSAIACHLRAVADLGAVRSVFEAAGVPWLVVKGPVLSERYYADPGLRRYGDLDLLVHEGDMDASVEALLAGGCRTVGDDADWRALARTGITELKLVLPNGTPGDLHWDLLHLRGLRERVRVPVAELFVRAREVSMPSIGGWVPTLDPTDTLIHLALHAAMSGGNRLVWLKDLERVIAAGVDWVEVAERAHGARTDLPVATMVSRASAVLGSPVPPAFFESMRWGWRPWAALARLTDAAASSWSAPSSRSATAVVLRSSRTGLASSVGALSALGTVGALRTVRHPHPTSS